MDLGDIYSGCSKWRKFTTVDNWVWKYLAFILHLFDGNTKLAVHLSLSICAQWWHGMCNHEWFPVITITSVCCFVLLTRGWGRLETRPPGALGSTPELFAFTMSLVPQWSKSDHHHQWSNFLFDNWSRNKLSKFVSAFNPHQILGKKLYLPLTRT